MSKAQKSKGCFSRRFVEMNTVPIRMERGVPAGNGTPAGREYEHAAYHSIKAEKKRRAALKKEANANEQKRKHPHAKKTKK